MTKILNFLKTIAKAVKSYLTDWRNLLTHSLVGVAFVVLAVWAPIPLHGKITVLSAIILLNVFRMRRKNKNQLGLIYQ
jgi:hypothetical protein